MASKRPKDPNTIDLSKSLGYGLFYIPFIGSEKGFLDTSVEEQFYALHRRSIRCQIYTTPGHIW